MDLARQQLLDQLINEPAPTTNAAVRALAELTIHESGECLLLHRPPNSAGVKIWYLVHRLDQFDAALATGRAASSFTLFLDHELPLRGKADSRLRGLALKLASGNEVLLAVSSDGDAELRDVESTDDPADVAEWFKRQADRKALVGPYPRFWLRNGESAVTAYVPDPDGIVRPAAY
jgi:hypothetical protein